MKFRSETPWIYLSDEHEPLVVIDVAPLDRPGVYDDSNWTLKISRKGKTLLSGALKADDLSRADRPGWSKSQCFGPYVTSRDGSGGSQVDLHFNLVLNKDKGESTYYFEKIFCFDKAGRKLRSLTHSWGENNPRLAYLRHDGTKQFITEDYKLENDTFGDSGGPLQIWDLTRHHEMVDVTRQFPKEALKHAKAAMARYLDDKKQGIASEHYLLSYYGDLCLAGEKKKAETELRRGKEGMQELCDKISAQLKKHGYL